MGRKSKAAEVIKVNPRDTEGRRSLPCMAEMASFMGCLKANNFDTDPCKSTIVALNTCMDTQVKKGKARSTINYHLQRIARSMRK